MGKRIGFETFDDLCAFSKRTFLDGIIRGEGIASITGSILSMATAFGGDEADRRDYFPASYRGETMDDLRRDAVEHAVERLFDGTKIDTVVRQIAQMGTAFGFQNIKNAAGAKVA